MFACTLPFARPWAAFRVPRASARVATAPTVVGDTRTTPTISRWQTGSTPLAVVLAAGSALLGLLRPGHYTDPASSGDVFDRCLASSGDVFDRCPASSGNVFVRQGFSTSAADDDP
jgi:hypothetical protein